MGEDEDDPEVLAVIQAKVIKLQRWPTIRGTLKSGTPCLGSRMPLSSALANSTEQHLSRLVETSDCLNGSTLSENICRGCRYFYADNFENGGAARSIHDLPEPPVCGLVGRLVQSAASVKFYTAFGGCNPGDASHSFMRDAVSAWRARFRRSSRAKPGGASAAAFRKRTASSADISSNVRAYLVRFCCWGIAGLLPVGRSIVVARAARSQSNVSVPLMRP